MSASILHVDMNAFYASVEQAKNPELKGKPVIVSGDPGGRGVVSAASYEARKFGVRSAMPSSTARRLCPNGVFVPVNMPLYISVSRQIFSMLGEFTPIVEPVSVDEAFLDVTGCDLMGSPVDIAQSIKQSIRSRFDITCSIGIAPNRVLAKLASDMQKPDGLTVITFDDLPKKVWPLPVERLIGVGEKTAKRLHDIGVLTIGQLARAPKDLLADLFGTMGPELSLMAQGKADLSWNYQSKQKSLGRETTFTEDVSDAAALRLEVMSLCDDIAMRLRSHGMQARTAHIKYRTPDFSTNTRAVTLPEPFDTPEPLFGAAWHLLESNLPASQALRLVGVSVSGLIESGELRQAMLPLDGAPERPVHKALDALREKFGKEVVSRASALGGPVNRH